MTDDSKRVLLKSMTEEDDDDILQAYIELAGEIILHYVDPFGISNSEDILNRYGSVQVREAAYLLNKRGAEGEMTHTENGITRTYEDGDIPKSLLRELTPICGATR